VTTETITRFEQELKDGFSGAASALDGTRHLLKLEVHFPAGCKPEKTRALVVLDPAGAAPELYLAELPTLASGNRPAGGTVSVGGKIWNTFSFALRNWNVDTHTAVQFVEGKLRRFALAS
jgi:hypothetical protein